MSEDGIKIEDSLIFEKFINIDKLEDNSLLVFRFKEITQDSYKSVEQLMNIYGEKLKTKNCVILFLKEGTSIEELKEVQMNNLGWIRKEKKSLIIS